MPGSTGDSNETTRALAELLDRSENVVILRSADGTCRWASLALQPVLGFAPEDIIGSTTSLLDKHDQLAVQEAFIQALETRAQSAHAQVQAVTAAGHGLWMDLTIDLWWSQRGELLHYAETMHRIEPDEAHFRTIAEHVHGAAFTASTDAVFTWMSPSISKVLGWEPEQMVGRRPYDFVHAGDQDVLANAVGAVGRGEPAELRLRMRDPEGTYRWLGVSVNPLLDAEGDVIMRVGTFRNIAQQVGDERQLETAERNYRDIVENMTDVVYRRGADGDITWVSPSITALLGWEAEEIVGHLGIDLVHPADRHRIEAARERIDVKGSDRVRVRMSTKSGGYRWVEITAGKMRGDPAGSEHIGAIHDVDAEQHALENLANSEQRLRTTLNAAPIGMSLLTPDGRYLAANPALCTLLDRSEEQLAGSNWQDFTHPDDIPDGISNVRRMLEEGEDRVRVMKRYLRPDGGVVWGDVAVSCVRDDDGAVRYLICQVMDATESLALHEKITDSEQQYRDLLHSLSEVVVARDLEGRITFVSPSVTNLLGWLPAELIGMSLLDLIFDDDLPGLQAPLARMAQGETMVARARVQCKDGRYKWVESTGQMQHAADGSVTGAIGTWRDVTDAVHAEQEASFEAERLSTITEHIGDIVIRLQNRVVTWASPSIAVELGGTTEEWIGLRFRDHVHPEDLQRLSHLRGLLASGRSAKTRFRVKDMGSEWRWLAGTVTSIDGQGREDLLLSLRIIDEEVAEEVSLQRMVGSDPLTGLANRTAFTDALTSMLGRRRFGEHVAVLFCDLDNLKEINDSFGHQTGDLALTTVAERLRTSLRSDDFAARVGGDEYLVALTGVDTGPQAFGTAEKIRKAVALPLELPDREVVPTLSIGVAVARHGEDPDALLRRADEAMYRAKRAGGNRAFFAWDLD